MASKFKVETWHEDTDRDGNYNVSFRNTLEFDADHIEDVIGNLELFLKGSGFVLNGHLDITPAPTQYNAFTNIPTEQPPGWYEDNVDPDYGSYNPDLNINIKRSADTEGGSIE